ncbi:hypothetical protein H2O64_06510 [Kordia sp. YSTF-M3]|uniref:DUF4868 domain-containing protein n=1 Tax=Kordia aestuariivivens TaxID=2759037 RepID=A0ABR7Q6X0_9FLAO|nr:hypothetical protein [Kordia aestuariivivens]MBC8754316.1 hypothetical protein [Kordia aestuariivivens]
MLNTFIPVKQNALANVVRILIYKEDESMLTRIDLDDDQIFLEPLLMAYFNKIQTEKSFPEGMLSELMQGYLLEKGEIKASALCNEDGIAYIPTLGYYKKGETTPFENLHIIPDTTIEVIKHEVPLLRNVIHIVSKRAPFEEEELETGAKLFEHNIKPLTNAIKHLKTEVSDYFSLAEMCLKKCIFYRIKVRPTSSFATINANGCLYIAIQENKDVEDEVEFIDVLGHYTGKILFTTLLHKQEEIFKINHRTRTTDIVETEDHRNLYTLYSNIFTNITACICLESCLNSGAFSDIQKQDAKVRMALYLKKYEVDIKKLEAVIAHFSGLENVFVADGVEIYNFMVNHAERISKNRAETLKGFDFSSFHYRMHYDEFSKINL